MKYLDEYRNPEIAQALVAEIRRGLRTLKRGAKIYTLEELLPEPLVVSVEAPPWMELTAHRQAARYEWAEQARRYLAIVERLAAR